MLENDFFVELKEYVFELFKNSLPSQVVFHNFNHTSEVVVAANEIAMAEQVSKPDLEVLLIAAWFHDVGYTEGYEKHEEKSEKLARIYLEKKEISDEKIAKVIEIINATKMPQNPTNKLENIICDADLFHLGSPNFKAKSNLLRTEWEQNCDRYMNDLDWYRENEKFLSEHKFFTNYAFEKLEVQKTSNWLKLKKDLQKIEKKEANLVTKVELGKKKENRPDRGIETMFRVTLRNHIKLSDIADTKANILLSVNAIILSVALSTLFPKLDKPSNAYLIIPTMIFMLTAVVTIIFAILATRPKVTSGKFTKADVDNKKVNLLFFGNFHKMPLEDFQNGMSEMMKDGDYLYKSLMKDLYFLGIVLNKKYDLLRIAYTIFMIGIVVSVLSFVISFAGL